MKSSRIAKLFLAYLSLRHSLSLEHWIALIYEGFYLAENHHSGHIDTQLAFLLQGPNTNPICAGDSAGLNKALITGKHCLFSVALALGPREFEPSGSAAFPQSLTYPLNTIGDLRLSLDCSFH